jgi:uncharacterized membrane protein
MTSKLLTLTLLSARSAAGTLLVKITCNVSRNDALATLDPFGAESPQFRTDYVPCLDDVERCTDHCRPLRHHF